MNVFFYGLFMDERLLATKGVKPADIKTACADGFGLHIGERATLVHRPGSRAWGVVMDITPAEAAGLYAERSVADYVPETISVELLDGSRVEATCYNLPEERVTGTNRIYAEALLELASRLSFPDEYLQQIRNALTLAE